MIIVGKNLLMIGVTDFPLDFLPHSCYNQYNQKAKQMTNTELFLIGMGIGCIFGPFIGIWLARRF